MSESPTSADIVIIGGGVIGLAIARSIGLRGLRNVLLIERAGLGSESSSAAAGMLAPQAEADRADEFFEFTCRSRDMYPAFASELREETGIDIELDTTGTLYVAFTEEDALELERRYRWQAADGLAVEELQPEMARLFEPELGQNLRAALRFPRDMQVENRRLISALAAANEELGISLEIGTAVTSLRIEHGKVTGVETSRGFVASENVVIASGAWSSAITEKAAGNLPSDKALPPIRIEPVRGQMLCFECNPHICRHVIYSPRGYIVPRKDGRLLAGSTTERSGFDKRVTAEGVHRILSAALEISPQIGAFPLVDFWAGLRPRAADGLPVMGPCAEIGGLFYATGHYRNGILLAPITAELLAGVIIDKTGAEALSAFSPDRFRPVLVN